MAVQATYALYVDWDNDGDFVTAGDDISSDWMEIRIRRGFSNPLARMCRVGQMTVLLKNAAQTYSPPTTADARPRKPVKLDMTYGGDTVTIFQGLIDVIRPSFGTSRDRRAVMECVDDTARLDQFEGPIELQEDALASDIIEAVVGAVYTPTSTDYDTGISYFPYSADRWGYERVDMTNLASPTYYQMVNAAQKIQSACASDWGRFYIAADGTPTFRNRHHTPFYATADLTLDDVMVAMDYQMGVSEIYNYIEVTCYPRTVGTTYEVLGQLGTGLAPSIEAGESETFTIHFRDPANNAIRLGGKNLVTPLVEDIDYEATSDEAGEGDDETSNVDASLTGYASKAEVTLTNNAAHPVYVQKLQVRGVAIRSQEATTVVSQDATSINAYGKRRLSLDAPLMSSPIDAQALAAWLLDYYKDPLHDVRGVTFFANRNATLMAAARDLDLLSRIVLTESQTGLSAEGLFVYGLRHQISNQYDHRVTLDLMQPYDYGADPFTIGTSTLGGTDVLVY